MTSNRSLARIITGAIGLVLSFLVCLFAGLGYARTYFEMVIARDETSALPVVYVLLAALCMAGIAVTARWSAAGLIACLPAVLLSILASGVPSVVLMFSRLEVERVLPMSATYPYAAVGSLALALLAGFGIGMLVRRRVPRTSMALALGSIILTPLLALGSLMIALHNFHGVFRAITFAELSMFVPEQYIALLAGPVMVLAGVSAAFSRWSLLLPALGSLALWGVGALVFSSGLDYLSVIDGFGDRNTVYMIHSASVGLLFTIASIVLVIVGHRRGAHAPASFGPVQYGPGATIGQAGGYPPPGPVPLAGSDLPSL